MQAKLAQLSRLHEYVYWLRLTVDSEVTDKLVGK